MAVVAIIGGGPAGLMAAEAAAARGVKVTLYDAMASVGRKFLLAGKGGLNLTHAEPMEQFLARYGTRRRYLEPAVTTCSPEALRAWARDLGVETFVGTSKRIFPVDLKSAPLLRTWLRRLRTAGVDVCVRHRWQGWDSQGRLALTTPRGLIHVSADAVVLALGGGSWPQLGSTGDWVSVLSKRGVAVAPLKPANCGFDVDWSDHFRQKFAGHPVKTVGISVQTPQGMIERRVGECVITEQGVEGSLIYSVSGHIRDTLAERGMATVRLDLTPDRSLRSLTTALSAPRAKQTVATHLKRRIGIAGVKAGLLREVMSQNVLRDPAGMAALLKNLPLRVVRPRPLEEAISTAGGVLFEELDSRLMLRSLPGVFCAGEMLDWEAPTGGYLLTACLATGRVAGAAAAEWAIQSAQPLDHSRSRGSEEQGD